MKKIIAVLIPIICGIIVLIINNFSTFTNEKNYYANGSKFNISLAIDIANISNEISDINDSLIKNVNLNDILDARAVDDIISFNGCNLFTLTVVFVLYDEEQRCLFKDYEIMTLTRQQIASLCNTKDNIKLRFQRDIQITLRLADRLTNNSNTCADIQKNGKIIPVVIFLKKDHNTIEIYERSQAVIIGTSSFDANGQTFFFKSNPKIIYGIEKCLGKYFIFD
ncbi:MAG: hypothetical protein LBC68_01950 [Prevotellaceae bacterium]|jgi:hypothetical protein|nr:hypothetical protein [Prevotellaceae bacterium]